MGTTAWKVSKYRVFSGMYFLVFALKCVLEKIAEMKILKNFQENCQNSDLVKLQTNVFRYTLIKFLSLSRLALAIQISPYYKLSNSEVLTGCYFQLGSVVELDFGQP